MMHLDPPSARRARRTEAAASSRRGQLGQSGRISSPRAARDVLPILQLSSRDGGKSFYVINHINPKRLIAWKIPDDAVLLEDFLPMFRSNLGGCRRKVRAVRLIGVGCDRLCQ